MEDISRRTTGDRSIAVAYDNESLYPYWWYFRNFPNHVWFADKPTRELRNNPIIIVGDANYSKIEPIVGNAYTYYETMRLWWPNQDYFNLTWERIRYALADPGIRAGIWQIWFNRDYTQYAKATNNQNLTLTTWVPSNKMRVYIRKDIASQIWKYGAAPAAPVVADPYEKGTIKLEADQVIGSPGNQPGQFDAPRGIALAQDGSLYVADSRNQRIQHLAADGTVIKTWGSFADANKGDAPGGTFNEPWDVAVGKDGSVFVADTWNNRIQKFTADGQFIKMWGYFGQAESPDAFWGPRGLAVNSKGQLLVTDTGNKRVVVFDPDGNFVTQFGSIGDRAGPARRTGGDCRRCPGRGLHCRYLEPAHPGLHAGLDRDDIRPVNPMGDLWMVSGSRWITSPTWPWTNRATSLPAIPRATASWSSPPRENSSARGEITRPGRMDLARLPGSPWMRWEMCGPATPGTCGSCTSRCRSKARAAAFIQVDDFPPGLISGPDTQESKARPAPGLWQPTGGSRVKVQAALQPGIIHPVGMAVNNHPGLREQAPDQLPVAFNPVAVMPGSGPCRPGTASGLRVRGPGQC